MSGSIIFIVEKGDKAARHLLYEKFSTHGCVVGQQPLGLRGGHCFRHIEGRIVFTSQSKGGRDVSDGIVKCIPRAQKIIAAIGCSIKVYFEWKAMARPETYIVEWLNPSSKTWHPFDGDYTNALIRAHAAKGKLTRIANKYLIAGTSQSAKHHPL